MLANHTYSHWHYPETDFERFSADVLRAEAVIASYPTFRKWFRFPYLKEGATAKQRDRMRTFLKAHGYRMGHVTVDASDWAIDARLRKRLAEDPHAALDGYRAFYLEHLWDRTLFYDRLARDVLHRPVKHHATDPPQPGCGIVSARSAANVCTAWLAHYRCRNGVSGSSLCCRAGHPAGWRKHSLGDGQTFGPSSLAWLGKQLPDRVDCLCQCGTSDAAFLEERIPLPPLHHITCEF